DQRGVKIDAHVERSRHSAGRNAEPAAVSSIGGEGRTGENVERIVAAEADAHRGGAPVLPGYGSAGKSSAERVRISRGQCGDVGLFVSAETKQLVVRLFLDRENIS